MSTLLVRRCAVLFIEPRESMAFDLASLLQGGDGLQRSRRWLALAPHLDAEVEVDAAEREALGDIPVSQWTELEGLARHHERSVLDRLLDKGLLLADDDRHPTAALRDQSIRASHWRPLSAAFHAFSRWQGVEAGRTQEQPGLRTFAEMVGTLGAPPAHFLCRGDTERRIALPEPGKTALDPLLARRVTCRNWDLERPLDLPRFAQVMHRVFAAQAVFNAAPDASVVKKTSPSGGGLHPTEAYLLVRRVEGVEPGLYHYHAGAHALEPLPLPATLAMAADRSSADRQLQDFASTLLAGQHWFGAAHVLVFQVARFRRHTWKYRNHAKAYKAMVLDVGHLSQTLYLAACELGLGAFVTGAVNDVEIEQALGIDPMEEGVIAVNGFGWRGLVRETVEFDPQQTVWQDWGAGRAE